jgi:hypothetical protein
MFLIDGSNYKRRRRTCALIVGDGYCKRSWSLECLMNIVNCLYSNSVAVPVVSGQASKGRMQVSNEVDWRKRGVTAKVSPSSSTAWGKA